MEKISVTTVHRNRGPKAIVALFALAAVIASQAPAQTAAIPAQPSTPPAAARLPTLALLDFSNAGMDPRVDYLGSILQGLLAFDLGNTGSLTLVDRRHLDAVLTEKELSLSTIGTDAGAAAEAGQLAGADWLVFGEYVFTGADVLLTISLTDTASAKRLVFRDRGSTENLVHHLAEQVILRLTGRQVTLADDSRSRSLVSLRDESPGSIALHSRIIRAEIFLDGTFVGYTNGDETQPFILDKVAPGRHRLRTHLDNSFGVVRLPDIAFSDWDVEVQVDAGKRAVVRDETRQLNYLLYYLLDLWGKDFTAPAADPGKLAFVKELSFVGRDGQPVSLRIEAVPSPAGQGLRLELKLSAISGSPASGAPASASPGANPATAGQATAAWAATLRPAPPAQPWKSPAVATMTLSRTGPPEDSADERELSVGPVKLSGRLLLYYGTWTLSVSLQRTDIWENMYDEAE